MEKDKDFSLDYIVSTAKHILMNTGSHLSVCLFVHNDCFTTFPLIFNDDASKDACIGALRVVVISLKLKRYWLVTEAWKSKVNLGDTIFKRASRDVDRQEILIISEFSSDGKNTDVIVNFKKDNDGKVILLGDDKGTGGLSIWDVYKDEKYISDKLDSVPKEINDAFIKKLAHELAEKYKKEFFGMKSVDEKKLVLKKLIDEGTERIESQKKTMLEDVQRGDVDEG